jgi:tetratricopeptide (TPR) repeat protein
LAAVSAILIGALGVLLATNKTAALSNFVAERTGVAVPALDTNDPVEKEFQKLMEQDDAAQEEVDGWIQENNRFAQKGAGIPREQMKQRILKRLEPVSKAYEDFIKAHPNHSRARVAYASFLGDVKGEEAAQEQLEKALAVDTNNPAIYNNLANIYGHLGPVTNAFTFYAKAIQLNPEEPVYYHNFGTTIYLFRKDAKEFYHIDEEQVFAKAFGLYSNAMRLDPDNFPLASDVAQSYYGIQPVPMEDALRAWTNALKIAHDEIEREGVYVHFARLNTMAGRFVEARKYLNSVTNEMYDQLKQRLVKNLNEKEATNAPAAKLEEKGTAPR